MRCILAIFLVFLSISTAKADLEKAKQIEMLEGLYEDLPGRPSFYETIVRAYALPPDRQPVFFEHARLMFSQDGFPRFLAEETVAAFPSLDAVDEPDFVSTAQQFGAALIQAKVVEGVRRLPAHEQREFYDKVVTILRNMDPSDCAASMRQSLNALEMAQAEIVGILKEDDKFVRDYLALTRKAGFAEIFDDPTYLALGSSERMLAAKRYEQEFIELLTNHPRSDAVWAASDMSTQHRDEDVCEFSTLALEAAVNVEGTIGDWVVKYISE